MQKPDAALSPAVCYHTYESLAVQTVSSPTLMTAEGVCWRHEGDRLAPLERGWAFRMREVVCIGTPEEVEECLVAFLIHAPNHVMAAANLAGFPPSDVFKTG